MKKYKLILTTLILAAGTSFMTSCSKDDNQQPGGGNPNGNAAPEVKTVTSLQADTKVYFNLTTGESVPESAITATNWDISFLGKDRTIVVAMNSGSEGTGSAGAQLVETGFDDLTIAPEAGYLSGKEATGDYLKWSNYTSTTAPQHAVLPKPGITIAIKTAEGKYAKMQIVSLYKGNPNTSTPEFASLATRPEFGHFTFRYATQTNGSRNF